MTLLRHSPLPRTLISASRRQYTTASPQLTIGLRREDPSRIWERRCPLTPDAVYELVHKENVNVHVQNCERRVFHVEEFIKAGAQIRENLLQAHIILGIKEVQLPEFISTPLPLLMPHISSPKLVARTHLMFSHTTKGQPYNMPLLSRFLPTNPGEPHDLLPRLIDYELLTNANGKRTVGFGWFAGVAGTLESLAATGHSHLELGVASPFLYTPRPHTHPSLASLRATLRNIGLKIANEGTPKSLGPFVIGLTGTGNVAEGVLSILKELPIVTVRVDDLQALVDDPNTDLSKIYLAHVHPTDYLSRIDGGAYDRAHYYANPSLYKSEFCTEVAPYLTLLLNGTGWSPSYPRLMSNEQLGIALARAQIVGKDRFINIGDISCDVEGGLEFLTRSSTLSSPFYKTRPPGLSARLPPVQMMAVDILPASIPLDASQHFSRALLPYLKAIIQEYRGERMESEYARALGMATVTRDGQLMEKHRWLGDFVRAWREGVGLHPRGSSGSTVNSVSSPIVRNVTNGVTQKKKVLILGSGMVAKPAVDEITKRSDVELLVASNSLAEADNLTRKHENATSLLVSMDDKKKVGHLIGQADVVISLLPVPFHPTVAELCIKHHKHLVTASYISPAMKALHHKALAADVLLLNEIGLDPGIDHCSAISLISKLRRANKRIISFTSFCGGIPSPECVDVPLGYKFSWSPRGVLSAALNCANFKLGGKDWHIPGEDILSLHFPQVPISNVLKLEGVANRDSRPYAESYQLGDISNMRTLLRGTLRYPGFSDLMHSFKCLGLLETTTCIAPSSWSSLARLSMELRLGRAIQEDVVIIRSAIRDLVQPSQIKPLLYALDWLFSSASLPPLPNKPVPPIDLFSTLLSHKLRYESHERDMVILHHEIIAQPMHNDRANTVTEEVHTSSLTAFGTPDGSAMSLCVGLPIAFAALRVMDGGVGVRGVVGPTDETVYTCVLSGLREVGLGMKETMREGAGIEGALISGLASRQAFASDSSLSD